MIGHIFLCVDCEEYTWLIGPQGKRRCAFCKGEKVLLVPTPEGPAKIKEPAHPHSEDAGQPYNRAQMARMQELRLALSATAVIAEEWQRNGGDPGPYLERIVARARDGLHAGRGDGE